MSSTDGTPTAPVVLAGVVVSLLVVSSEVVWRYVRTQGSKSVVPELDHETYDRLRHVPDNPIDHQPRSGRRRLYRPKI